MLARTKASLLSPLRRLKDAVRTRALATEVQAPSSTSAPSSSSRKQRKPRTPALTRSGVPEPDFASQILHGRSVLAPIQHEKKHGIPVAAIHLRGHNHHDLELFSHFASHAASALAIPMRTARLPTQRRLWTVPKGPFVHKKNQENFERRVHKRVMTAWDATDTVVERWLEYIMTYPQPGIGLRVVRWRRAPLGIGRKAEGDAGEKMVESVRLGNVTSREKVEKLAEEIVKVEMGALKEGKKEVVLEKKDVETNELSKSS